MRTFQTMNPMADKKYDQCRACCIEQLSNGIMLYGNAKQAHWNVKGVNALDTHRFFDEIAEMLLKHVDTLGERCVQLGGYAMIDPKANQIPELPGKATNALEMTAAIADGLAKYIEMLHGHITMSGDCGDLVSQNIFLDLSQDAEKMLMFLEMHLQK